MNLNDISPAEQAELVSVLKEVRARGVIVPLLPMDVDVDGDGVCDAFGLDENDNLVIVSGVDLDLTLYEATGEDA